MTNSGDAKTVTLKLASKDRGSLFAGRFRDYVIFGVDRERSDRELSRPGSDTIRGKNYIVFTNPARLPSI